MKMARIRVTVHLVFFLTRKYTQDVRNKVACPRHVDGNTE